MPYRVPNKHIQRINMKEILLSALMISVLSAVWEGGRVNTVYETIPSSYYYGEIETTQNEWTNNDGCVVDTQEEAQETQILVTCEGVPRVLYIFLRGA